MENEITKVEAKPTDLQVVDNGNSTMAKILDLMSNGAEIDVATIEKMMELDERHQANEARKAFHVAMAEFKADPPRINKDLSNGQYNSKYASLAIVTESINVKLGEYGLSASWRETQKENGYPEVTCIIAHEQGHSESTKLSAPPDISGKKNPIQQILSTITYLKRATLLSITGLATSDASDDDGNGAYVANKPEVRLPTATQLEVVQAICSALPPKEGFTPNFETITGICMHNFRDYLLFEKAPSIAEHLTANHSDDQLYMAVATETEAAFEAE